MSAAMPKIARAKASMADNGERLLPIPAHLVADLKRASEATPYALSNAAHIFDMLQRLTGSGFGLEECELIALCELCGRGLRSMADIEGEALASFDMVLREHLATRNPEEED